MSLYLHADAAPPALSGFRRRSPWLWAALAFSPVLPMAALAQASPAAEADSQTFTLGTVEVSGQRQADQGAGDMQRVNSAEMAQENANTVADAVRQLPGISLSRNSRNEEMINVRGFDSRQVPIYVDGIPLYVPYDGYVDLGRFTTFDLAEINVAKAGASLLYGPNTLGGAINLVTRKPVKAFEGDARIGFGSGKERKAAVNLGGNLGSWYYQLGASYLDADNFPLPKGFKDFKAKPTDTGSKRENAYRTDKRLSFKVGLTPNATDEYALGYVRQEGEKGNPVYTGTSKESNAIRYWRWPSWDKNSLYFLSTTRIGSDNVLKTRLYRDTYENGMESFKDANYLAYKDPLSRYKDVSQGGNIEWANYSLRNHELRFALHYKQDEHTDEANSKGPEKYYREATTSLSVEDRIQLADRWTLTLGLSHDKRDAKVVHEGPASKNSANNGLLKLSYALSPQGGELYAIASHKTRFPTLKDRYSYKMNSAVPNPYLKPEVANHFEIGASGSPWQGGKGQAAVFYSRVNDQIQNMTVNSTACGGTTCGQNQNVGKTRNWGLELSLAQKLSAQWSVNAGYTYLNRTNLSDPNVTLTDTPRQRLSTSLQWNPHAQWQLRAELEAEQGRKVPLAASRQSSVYQMAGYGVLNLRARYLPRPDTTLDFGVANVGDKWYELADGLPMPGRTLYVNLGYRF